MTARGTRAACALVLGLCLPGCVSNGSNTVQTKPIEPALEFRFVGSRQYQVLYWRIDANGKGEVSAPAPVGYYTDFGSGGGPRYHFQGGTSQFDIGRSGYQELRQVLSAIIDGKVDSLDLQDLGGDPPCTEGRVLDRPSMQLSWSGAASGAFVMPNACLSALGKQRAAEFAATWRVLARHMMRTGHPGVSAEAEPALSVPAPLPPAIPLVLSYEQRSVWTGWSFGWQIDADGKGWMEVSEAETMALDAPEHRTIHVPKGRHPIDVGRPGYTMIRSLLEPYISGPQRNAHCDGMSDQPLVSLTFENASRSIRGQTWTDLGCTDFARRAGQVAQVILTAYAAGQQQSAR